MSESHCPICYAPLEFRDVAPCWDCGANPGEIDHLANGRHTYAEVRVYGAVIVLCDFCQLDFGSYAAGYFGQARRARLGQGLTLVRQISEPRVSKDKYCPNCARRLAFLRFLADVRERGAEEQMA